MCKFSQGLQYFFGTVIHMTMDDDANSDVTMDRQLVNVTSFIFGFWG
jgi:hypothetical protein